LFSGEQNKIKREWQKAKDKRQPACRQAGSHKTKVKSRRKAKVKDEINLIYPLINELCEMTENGAFMITYT